MGLYVALVFSSSHGVANIGIFPRTENQEALHQDREVPKLLKSKQIMKDPNYKELAHLRQREIERIWDAIANTVQEGQQDRIVELVQEWREDDGDNGKELV